MGSPDYELENEQKLDVFFALSQMNLSIILKIFLTFKRFEPGDSYKLDSLKKSVLLLGPFLLALIFGRYGVKIPKVRKYTEPPISRIFPINF